MTQSSDANEAFRRALAATTRALSARPHVEIAFGGERADVRGDAARLPAPPPKLAAEKVAETRGAADAAALKLAHHSDDCHQRHRPPGADASAIFDALEDARIQSIGSNALRGVSENLSAALEKICADKGYARMEDRQDAPLADVLALLAREKLTGAKAPPSAEALIDYWRPQLEDKAGARLTDLADACSDQTAFAKLARELIRDLELGDQLGDEPDENEDSEEGQSEDALQPEGNDEITGDAEDDSADAGEDEEMGDGEEGEGEEAGPRDQSPEEMNAQEANEGEPDANAPGAAAANANEDRFHNYHAYTTRFDQTIGAEELCDAEELTRLRQMLDRQLQNLHSVVSRLANRLQRRLMAQQNRAWDFDLEEGVLDAARLPRVVIDPTTPLSYKQERDTEFRDTVVTLLIDNSGSMRGRPITVAAMCADILARTLERCGVKVEILGFTTLAWKGGQSRESWVKDGRPADPGRLNDLRHLIYKAADTPWRRARKSLGLMMREGLLKENIDGEALLWAHERLLGRMENRRILMVIS
ncbi:MAG: cobaltochelatase subunit CobT, partial [Pseudomonadota bacterium]